MPSLTLHSRYLDREGKSWTVVGYDPGFTYPYVAVQEQTGSRQSFTATGRWTNLREWNSDLVQEKPVLEVKP